MDKLSQRYSMTQAEMKRVFLSADVNRNGQLDLQKLFPIMDKILVGIGSSQIHELIRCYDVHNTGSLSFDEFFDILRNIQPPSLKRSSPHFTVPGEVKRRAEAFLTSLRSDILQMVKTQSKSDKFTLREGKSDAISKGRRLLTQKFSTSPSQSIPIDHFYRFSLRFC